jgi:homoserine acetyltransferase
MFVGRAILVESAETIRAHPTTAPMKESPVDQNDYYSEENHGPHETFELGDFTLECGATLRGARLLYKTQGKLNEARDNAILFPHMWSGTSKSMEIFVGEGRALDPSKYFIIFPGHAAAIQRGSVSQRRNR